MQCKICGQVLSGRQRLYCSKECCKVGKREYKRKYYAAHRDEIREYYATHRDEIRIKQKMRSIRKYMEAKS